MQRLGVASWRFAESVSQLPHIALYVRDAVRLPIGYIPIIPPALAGAVADRRSVLPKESSRRQAASEWTTWWRDIVGHEIRAHGPRDRNDQISWVRRIAEDGRRLIDPPDFVSLADRPALQQAVVATFGEAVRWADSSRQPARAARPALFAPETVTTAAEQVIDARHVSPDQVHGTVLLLAVDGRWWHLVGPGAAIASQAAADDSESAATILKAVFTSSVVP